MQFETLAVLSTSKITARGPLTLLAILAVLCAAPASVAPAQDLSPAADLAIDVQQRVLDNGVTVLVWERPSGGRIGTRMFYRVDIAAERPGTVGLTHMLEHYLFKGSDLAGSLNWEAEQAVAASIERVAREITDEKNRNRDCFRQREVFAEVERDCRTPRLEALESQLGELIAEQDALSDPVWYDKAVQYAGGSNSTASTGRDWMKFDIDLPANKLELFMWTERIRVENPVFRQFEAEREVVVDQIRRGDNRPDGKFNRVLRSMTYDAHPYGWAHWFSDLTRATREDHWEIFHKYFIPQNAIIVVVGDVEAEEVFDMAEEYWGDWQRARPSPRLRTVEPPPVGQKRLTVTAAAGPTVALNVPMPAVGHDDSAAFDVLAELLGGRQGLLETYLVDERQIATTVGASSWTSKYPSHFSLRADGRANDNLEEIEAGINAVIARVADGEVTQAAIDAAAGRLVLGVARNLEAVGRSAVTIGSMEAIHRWDYINELPRLWRSVTPADLARIVRTYFEPEMRTIGVLRRAARAENAGAEDPGAPPSSRIAADLNRVRPGSWPYGGPVEEWFFDGSSRPPSAPVAANRGPESGAEPETAQSSAGQDPEPLSIAEQPFYGPPWMAERQTSHFASPAPALRYEDLTFEPRDFIQPDPGDHRIEVANGPTAFIAEDPLLPVVMISVLIDAPAVADPRGKEGLAALTSAMLQRVDTTRRTRDEIEAAFDRLGATIRIETDRNRTLLQVVAPAAGAEETLEIVSELLTQPRFEPVFEAERQRMAVQAGRASDSAGVQIAALFEGTLYGDEHPLGRRATAASVSSIELEDVRGFHASRYAPDRMVFAISGAVERASVEPALAAGFASSAGRSTDSVEQPEFPEPREPVGRTVVTREIDSRQGHVIVGHLGIENIPEDHAALEVMNYVLSGGGFVSRMMKLLRTDTGITAALSGEVEPGRGTTNPYVWRFSGRPETLARGIRLALEQIQRMHDEGVTPEEFEGARTAYLDGLIPASYETSHRVVMRLAQMELFGLYDYQSPQYLNYYAGDEQQAAAMRRLTIEDVNRAARKYLHPDNLIIAVAGPLDRIRAGATPEELELVRGR